jgi:hypothetical protein
MPGLLSLPPELIQSIMHEVWFNFPIHLQLTAPINFFAPDSVAERNYAVSAKQQDF